MLRDATRLANRLLFDSGRTRPSAAGRSVSASLAVVCGAQATVAHVGDARAVLIRAGEVQALTRAHTIGNLMEGQFGGTPVPVGPTAPGLRDLSRALGRDRDVQVDVHGPLDLIAGDVIVLTTAGLHEALTDRDLLRAVAGDPADPAEATGSLVACADRAGATSGSIILLCACDTLGRTMQPTPVPEVERPADMLTPSSADLELVARLASQPRPAAQVAAPKVTKAVRRAELDRLQAQELARQRVLLGAIIGMALVAVLLLLTLVSG